MSLTSGSLMLLGATMNPQVAFNLSARLPHLPLRMREHGRRALLFASRLHALGLPVCYPGLPSHPQAHVLARISNGSRPHLLASAGGVAGGGGVGGESGGAEWVGPYAGGGMLSLDLGSTAMAYDFMRHLQNNAEFGYMAVSLGFHDSLVSCSGASTSSEMRAEQQQAVGISPGLVRMSVGYTTFLGALVAKASEDARDMMEELLCVFSQYSDACSKAVRVNAKSALGALAGSEGRFAARQLMQLAAVLHFTDATIRAHAAALVHRHLVGAQPARAGAGSAGAGAARGGASSAWRNLRVEPQEALNCIFVPAVRARAALTASLRLPSSIRQHGGLCAFAALRPYRHPYAYPPSPPTVCAGWQLTRRLWCARRPSPRSTPSPPCMRHPRAPTSPCCTPPRASPRTAACRWWPCAPWRTFSHRSAPLWHRSAALLPDVAAPGLCDEGEGSAVSGCSAGGEAQRAGGARGGGRAVAEGRVDVLLGLVPLTGWQVDVEAAREDVERVGRQAEGEDEGEAEGVVGVVGMVRGGRAVRGAVQAAAGGRVAASRLLLPVLLQLWPRKAAAAARQPAVRASQLLLSVMLAHGAHGLVEVPLRASQQDDVKCLGIVAQ
ncbi:unnamed protein product [Closterium sp. Naga37s-1]|nr:unnamed protein product [Closterium sp. Naga37s-1]